MPAKTITTEDVNCHWAEHMAEAKGEGHKESECSTCEDLADLYAEAVAAEAAANYGQSPEYA